MDSQERHSTLNFVESQAKEARDAACSLIELQQAVKTLAEAVHDLAAVVKSLNPREP